MASQPGIAVGARIRALRTERGLSLSALAAAAGIGKGSLSELETGRRNPTLDTLYAARRAARRPARVAGRLPRRVRGRGRGLRDRPAAHRADAERRPPRSGCSGCAPA